MLGAIHLSVVLIGFVINPIAGMGGSVALKGTDGEAYQQALARGATPIARGRAVRALSKIEEEVKFLTAAGDMGGEVLKDLGFPFETVLEISGRTGSVDTIRACRAFLDKKADLVVFCGGDGTARDVMDAIGDRLPVIGIPSGVKMHSAVFANTPEEAGASIDLFVKGNTRTRSAEVMDVDEGAFRKGQLQVRLYGYLKVPDLEGMQPPKGSVFMSSDEEQKEAIAEFVVETMEPGTVYILGPGTTTKAVAERLGLSKTLLGVDVILDGRILIKDASEEDILRITQGRPSKLLVTPIGRQGFIFGRGNQQISAEVIRRIGVENVGIMATPAKLSETPVLRSDSGDLDLDKRLGGYRRVLIGYDQYRMVRCL